MKHTKLAVSVAIISSAFYCRAADSSVDIIFTNLISTYRGAIPLGLQKGCVNDPYHKLPPAERLMKYAESFNIIRDVVKTLRIQIDEFQHLPDCATYVEDRTLLDGFRTKIKARGALLINEMDTMKEKVFTQCCINAVLINQIGYGEELAKAGVIKREEVE